MGLCIALRYQHLIQVLVTRERMQQAMGSHGPKSMVLGTFFGFISSSCSFAALATTRSLFQKGAGLAPSMAFLLASTNLVIELGIVIVIAIFLSWQFVAAEYVGGILLILFAWGFIAITRPDRMIKQVRERFEENRDDNGEGKAVDWRSKISSREGWQEIGMTYVMEWQMVWKDVLIGFTVAGIIAAFLPESFFHGLFIGAGEQGDPGFLALLAQTLIGPVAAFFTFIGSMGNIPLAAVLFSNGVSFAGVMAFIFSDLVVLPVLRINATYYGWKMSLYILMMLLSGLIFVSLAMHYGLGALDLLPDNETVRTVAERDHFQFNSSLVLNLLFLALSVVLVRFWWQARKHSHHGHHHHHGGGATKTQIVAWSFLHRRHLADGWHAYRDHLQQCCAWNLRSPTLLNHVCCLAY